MMLRYRRPFQTLLRSYSGTSSLKLISLLKNSFVELSRYLPPNESIHPLAESNDDMLLEVLPMLKGLHDK